MTADRHGNNGSRARRRPGFAAMLRAAAVRTLVLAALWWVLIEGDPAYAHYALFAVPPAVGFTLWLSPPTAPGRAGAGLLRRLAAAAVLVGWVAYRAVAGGADVARRAVARGRGGDTDPAEVTVPIRLTGTARVFALATFNLMPGTLVRDHDDDAAVVHVLSPALDAAGSWSALEDRVGAVAGQDLKPG